MKKVKLTKEQEKAIQERKFNYFETDEFLIDFQYFIHSDSNKDDTSYCNEHECLNDITPIDLAKALLVGYEIEQPKFKVGDWVLYKYDSATRMTTKIIDIQYEHNRVQFENVSGWKAIHEIERLVTKEEIFWAELGREYREFRNDDIIILQGELGFKIHHGRQVSVAINQWEKGKVTGIYPAESFKPFPKDDDS